MNEQIVIVEKVGSAAVLTFNRPEKLNALDYATIDTLSSLLDDIEKDDTFRTVVLKGAGDRAFSAGADVACFASSVEAGVEVAQRDFVRRGHKLTSRIENFSKPVIAAVNGIAYGGGCEIVEASHLAIASQRAQFAKPEIRLGFPPPFGGTQRLPRLVGRKRAVKMILTAELIGAQEACAMGLVNSVVEHERLLCEALGLAERIAAHSALAVAACLVSVTRGINLSIDEGLFVEAACFSRMVATQDIQEGIRAFLEHRQPAFVGR